MRKRVDSFQTLTGVGRGSSGACDSAPRPVARGADMSRSITLSQAEAVLEGCRNEAVAIGQPMNIAVVDDGGHLVAFCAMDDTKLIGNDISQRKERTGREAMLIAPTG